MKKFLKSIGWSWKVPTTFHINKYSIENIENYLLFVDWIKKQDPKKLKFCDESHLVPRHMDARLVCGLKSKRVYHRNNTSHEPNSSISIITSVCRDQMPVFVDYREETNTGEDFFNFICSALEDAYLRRGDYLICDNASVHHQNESVTLLKEILRAFGVQLVFLPAYSPELNPCELVFGNIKRYIRNSDLNALIVEKLFLSFGTINHKKVRNFYKHCIFPKVLLPEL